MDEFSCAVVDNRCFAFYGDVVELEIIFSGFWSGLMRRGFFMDGLLGISLFDISRQELRTRFSH